MRSAILISGYLRTFKVNLPKIKETIFNKLENIDIYIHLTKNEYEEDVYLNISDFNKDIDYVVNELKPLSIICEDNYHYSDNKKINNTYNLWFKYYKLNEIKKLNEQKSGFKYDLVIKYRPDLNLITTDLFDEDFKKETIFIPKESLIDTSKLNNSDDIFICDIFAYGNSIMMDKYFSIFEKIEDLLHRYGSVSETILIHYLRNENISYTLKDIDYNVILSNCNVFAICGDSGSGKTTLGNILKKMFSNSFMLECDRYHKWERNDENWKKFTHLNPESNFLTKMNQDIFNLKIGNTIYQVDYDHKTGKFTENEIIDSSDNLIVCGLHSLYTEDENLYNLKIYIDTEESLKNYWKIERDTKERGYTLEKSLNQIESRKKDYIKYIYPQRDKSDIIINFYYPESLESGFDREKISLKILVKKNYDVKYFIDTFAKLGEDFQSQQNENFYILDFKKYQKIDSILYKKDFVLNSFYDYIIFIITQLKK